MHSLMHPQQWHTPIVCLAPFCSWPHFFSETTPEQHPPELSHHRDCSDKGAETGVWKAGGSQTCWPRFSALTLLIHWWLCCVHVSRLAALFRYPFLCFSEKRIRTFASFPDQAGCILDVGDPPPPRLILLSELCILNASTVHRVQLETVPQGRGAGCILRYSSAVENKQQPLRLFPCQNNFSISLSHSRRSGWGGNTPRGAAAPASGGWLF